MVMIPPVVFDIDMTLTSGWYRNGQVRDLPGNHDMITLAHCLNRSGVPIVIATARREDLRNDTKIWLEGNNIVYQGLYMRAFDDYRHDPYVKRDQAIAITQDYGKPILWYDDNAEVCSAIREYGIPCIQVFQQEDP